jgi:hypothetical protein
MRAGVTPLVLVLAIGLSSCAADGAGGGDVVHDYCAYGAVSEAQLEGCESHVSEATVDGYDTNAARYARGELSDCLADSGPFCEPR